jgi:hypothetical protein
MPLGVSEQQRIANDQYSSMATAPAAPVSGAPAIEKAADQGQMAGADSVLPPSEETNKTVKIVGSRTFVKNKDVWVDTAFDPDNMQTNKVPFLSDDYFALSASRPELAAAFSLGSRVIALSDGIAYEIVDSSEPTTPIQIPANITADPGTTIDPGNINPTPAKPISNPLCVSGLLALLPFGLMVYLRRSTPTKPK